MLAASDARYDLIILDAFSSDAIPVHLLTREAFAIYRSRLAPHGELLIHGSNRHLDLVPIVAAGAEAEGMVGLLKEEGLGEPVSAQSGRPSVVALAREPADLGDLPGIRLAAIRARGRNPAWTDDYQRLRDLPEAGPNGPTQHHRVPSSGSLRSGPEPLRAVARRSPGGDLVHGAFDAGVAAAGLAAL